MDSPSVSYGLESIVLHHSFKNFAGRTVRVECQNRTHVGGTNGAGKTSILQLIPAFYGEEPERIVNRAGGRESFVDFYLKSLQSLIIFEYRRSTGLCCAVLFRHPSGKLCYRFVEGGLEETFFSDGIKPLLESGATNDVVFQALRELGIGTSQMIDTITDYRAIIQRNPKLIKRQADGKRRLQALANDYGLGSPDTRMSHIDRLTHVVLNKNRLLSSFKTMICETMFEEIHLIKRPTILHERDLVNDILSLKAFEGEETAIRQCLVKEAERKSLMDQAQLTASKLRVTVKDQQLQREELLATATTLDTTLEARETEFQDKDQEFSRNCADLSNKVELLNKHIKDIYEQRDKYEEHGLPELDRDLENLAEYHQQYKHALDDHKTLTEKVTGLETEHEAKIDQIQKQFEQDQARRTQSADKADQDLKDKKKTHEHELARLKSEGEKEVSTYRESRHTKRPELGEELVRLQTQLENVSLTQVEQSQIEEATASVKQADEALRATREQLTEATQKRDQARRDRSTAHELLEDAKLLAGRIDAEFEALRQQMTPDKDSWLAQLRKEDPRWGETLGKIINPDLLMRPDLNPALTESDSDTVLGWRLDTDALPVPGIAASEAEIQARLTEKDEQRQRAHKSEEAAETTAQKSNHILQEREREIEQVAGRYRIHEKHLESAQLALASTQTSANEARENRKKELAEKLKDTTAKLKEFDLETQQAVSGLKEHFSTLNMDKLATWAARESELKEAIENALTLVKQASTSHAQRIATLNEAYASRLKDEGVDPAEVRRAREKKDTLQNKIQSIENAQTTVYEYRSWRTREWGQIESLQTESAERGKELTGLEQQRQTLRRQHKDDTKELKDKIKLCRVRAGGIATSIGEAETILSKFPATDADPAALPGNLKILTDQLSDGYRELEKLRQEVIKAIRKATTVIGKYESTQVYMAWNNLQEHRVSGLADSSDRYTEEFELSQTESLRWLMERDLPQLKSALVDQFASAAGELGDYLDSLKLLVREVSQVSSKLQQAINTDQQIDSISDIRVTLKPRIYEDESWLPLKNFVESWRNWRLSHRVGREIPSDELVNDFHVVVTTLRSARIRGDVESMVDMTLQMKENDRQVDIRNDNDLLNASSTGLTYLAIMAIFIGMTRYLAPDTNTRITWGVDELGTLSANNISRLADMLEKQNISMMSACPKLDHGLRKFFETKVSIKGGRINIYGQKEAAADTAQDQLFAQAIRQPEHTEDHDYAQ